MKEVKIVVPSFVSTFESFLDFILGEIEALSFFQKLHSLMRFQAFPYLGDGGVLLAVFVKEIISEFVVLSFVLGETSATGVF